MEEAAESDEEELRTALKQSECIRSQVAPVAPVSIQIFDMDIPGGKPRTISISEYKRLGNQIHTNMDAIL
jgi:hypothetical protein